MWIRSQNKKSLVDAKSLHVAGRTDKETQAEDFAIVEYLDDKGNVDLGNYETEARAIKINIQEVMFYGWRLD